MLAKVDWLSINTAWSWIIWAKSWSAAIDHLANTVTRVSKTLAYPLPVSVNCSWLISFGKLLVCSWLADWWITLSSSDCCCASKFCSVACSVCHAWYCCSAWRCWRVKLSTSSAWSAIDSWRAMILASRRSISSLSLVICVSSSLFSNAANCWSNAALAVCHANTALSCSLWRCCWRCCWLAWCLRAFSLTARFFSTSCFCLFNATKFFAMCSRCCLQSSCSSRNCCNCAVSCSSWLGKPSIRICACCFCACNSCWYLAKRPSSTLRIFRRCWSLARACSACFSRLWVSCCCCQ